MRRTFIYTLLILSIPMTSCSDSRSLKGTKPNIILVITDDQGMGDLGCMGNPIIKTPHLDDFYNEAVRFTNFHVSTTCAPTRGALMTGRHTNRLNVFHTISGRSLLFEDEVILPQVLARNGYTNGMFGKWHLGDNYPYRPDDRGFHEVVRHGGGGIPRDRTTGAMIISMIPTGTTGRQKPIRATARMYSFPKQCGSLKKTKTIPSSATFPPMPPMHPSTCRKNTTKSTGMGMNCQSVSRGFTG